MPIDFDFHTHRLDLPPGTGIVSLPQPIVLHPNEWQPHPNGLYAAGIHPWWTAEATFSLCDYLTNLSQLWSMPQVVQVGECGFDRLKGADLETQWRVFCAQAAEAEARHLPMTLHVVRAFDLALRARKEIRPQQVWTIHGFRGKPALAQQLLDAGFDLSFGTHFNEASYALTPPHRRHRETDSMS